MQLCSECDLQVVNTFSGLSVAELVTYRDIYYQKGNAITGANHELLDLVLSPRTQAYRVTNLKCIQDFALISHPYLVVADLNVDLCNASPGKVGKRIDIALLKEVATKHQFQYIVEAEMEKAEAEGSTTDVNMFSESWKHAFHISCTTNIGQQVC